MQIFLEAEPTASLVPNLSSVSLEDLAMLGIEANLTTLQHILPETPIPAVPDETPPFQSSI